jgi:hypothetical protein
MTRKDYTAIGLALIKARPRIREREDDWCTVVAEIGSTLWNESAHNDINGNLIHRFNPKRWADYVGVYYTGISHSSWGSDTLTFRV